MRICIAAAKNEQLAVIIWALDNGVEWNSAICSYAAHNGHLNIIIWAKENGYDYVKAKCLAITTNHEIIKWLNEN